MMKRYPMMIRRFIAAFFVGALFTQSASALSCMRPDVMKKMEAAKASDDLYHIFVGRFDTPAPRKDGTVQKPEDYLKLRPPRHVTATFTGKVLSQDPRFDAPAAGVPVELQISCAGPWCGSAPRAEDTVIAFVQARDGLPPLLRIGACPDNVFNIRPKDKQIQSLRDCFDKSCRSAPKADLY